MPYSERVHEDGCVIGERRHPPVPNSAARERRPDAPERKPSENLGKGDHHDCPEHPLRKPTATDRERCGPLTPQRDSGQNQGDKRGGRGECEQETDAVQDELWNSHSFPPDR